ERRTRQLVHAGEAALLPLQRALATKASTPQLRILDTVEKPAAGCHPYSRVFGRIQTGILYGFIGGALYAAWPRVAALPRILSLIGDLRSSLSLGRSLSLHALWVLLAGLLLVVLGAVFGGL